MELETANSIVIVGDGRGFVVAGPREGKLIITAAHCLPHLPRAHRARYPEEATYANLIGPIGEAPKIWAECLFADSVADLAILGPTDNQEFGEQSDAYDDFVEPIKPIAIADTKAEGSVFKEEGRVWFLSLNLQWYPELYSVYRDRPLCFGQETKTEGGMSGSPIVNDDGAAVGVVTVSAPSNPRLARDLPGWLLRIAGFRK